eukprot:TRINITY_DN4977_c0_g1_i2.p1 TRINITY_DN4977_c0_g1~~TRINITY_DN4977_c0_g1_i2.p1  ORF type:complete len:1976 (+),score=531.97 TRINITY_DN4977_c0_g1_i2:64-5928(+)
MTDSIEAEALEWDHLGFQQGVTSSLGDALEGPQDEERRGNYLAVSNTYGYTIAVVPQGLRVMKTSEINGTVPDRPEGAVPPAIVVPVSGSVFGIALATDDLTLAVASGSQILLFDLIDISQRKSAPFGTIDCPAPIRDIKFARNPSPLLGVLVSASNETGDLYIYDTANLSRKTAKGSAFGAQIAAFDWPPTGIEEIATCTHSGDIEVFSINADLTGTSKATRQGPQMSSEEEDRISKVVQMFWWSKENIFLAAMCGQDNPAGVYFIVPLNPNSVPSHCICSYLETASGYVLTVPLTYMKLLVILTPQAITEECLAFDTETRKWLAISPRDDARLTLPPDPSRSNSTAAPLGFALDRTSKKPIRAVAAGEPDLAPVPILLVLTSIGSLMTFHAIDGKNKQKSPSVMINNVLPLPATATTRVSAGASTTPFSSSSTPAAPTATAAAPAAAKAPPAAATTPASGFGFGSGTTSSFSLGGAAKKEPAPASAPFGAGASSFAAPSATSTTTTAAPTGFGIGGSSFAAPAAKATAAAAPTTPTLGFGGVSAAPKPATETSLGFGGTTAAPSGTSATSFGGATSFGSVSAAAPLSGSAKVAAPTSLRASGNIPAESPTRTGPAAAFPSLSSAPVASPVPTAAAQKAPAPQPTAPEAAPKMPAPVSPLSIAPQPTRVAPAPVAAVSTPVASTKQPAPVPAAASSGASAAAKTVSTQFDAEVKSFSDDMKQIRAFAAEIEEIMAEATSTDPAAKKTKFRLKDFERLVQKTAALRRQYTTVAAEYESAHKELNNVKQMYIESITERAEAKSQMEMRDNPQYLRLVQKRQLDPEARALRAKMHDATLRVETSLHQVEEQLTSIHNEKYRATVKGGKQPHIKLLSHHLNLKDKPIAGDELIVQKPSWETLWATLRQNVQIIRSQQNRVSEMSQTLDRLRRTKPTKLARDRVQYKPSPRAASPGFKKPLSLPATPMRQAPVYDPEDRKLRTEDRKRRNKRLSTFKEIITEAATGPDRWISVRKQSEFEADQTLSIQEEKERKREMDNKRLAEREAERTKAVSAMQAASTPATPAATAASAKSTPISVYYTNSFPGTEKQAPATPASPSTSSQTGTPSNIVTPTPKPAFPTPSPVPMTAGRPSLSALTASPSTGVSGLLIPPTKLPAAMGTGSGGLSGSALGESMFGSDQEDTPAASAARSTANVSKALANLPSSTPSPAPSSPAPVAALSFGSAPVSPAPQQLSPTKSGKSKMGKIGISTAGEFAFGASAPQRASLSLSQSLQPESEDDEGSFSESEESQEDPGSPVKKPIAKQTAAPAPLAKFSISAPSTASTAPASTAPLAAAPAPAKTSPLASFGGGGFGSSFAAPSSASTATAAAAKAPAPAAGFGLGGLSALGTAAAVAKPAEASKAPLTFGAPAPTSAAPSGAAKKLDFGAATTFKPAAAVAPAPAATAAAAASLAPPAKSTASALRTLLPESDNEEDEEDPEDYSGDEDDPNATHYEDDEYGQEEEYSGEEEGEDDGDGELTRPSSPVEPEADAPQPLKVVVKNTAAATTAPTSGLKASTGAGVAPASAFGSILGGPAKASAPNPASASTTAFGSGFSAAPAKQPAPAASTGFAGFGGASAKSTAPAPTAAAPTPFGSGFGTPTGSTAGSAAPASNPAPAGFGGGFGAASGAATTGTSGFGGGFGASAKATGATTGVAAPAKTSFGAGFGGSSPAAGSTSAGFGGAAASPAAASTTAAPSSGGKFGLGGLSMGGGFQTASSPSQPAPTNSFSGSQPASTAASFAGTSNNKPAAFGGGSSSFGQPSALGASPSGGFGQPSTLGSAAPSGFGAAGARSPPSGGMPAAFGGGASSFGQPSALGASPSSGFGAGANAMGSGVGAVASQLGGGQAADAAAMLPQGQGPMMGGGGSGGLGAIAGGGGGGFGGAPSSGGFGGMAGGQQQGGFGAPGGAPQWTQARK